MQINFTVLVTLLALATAAPVAADDDFARTASGKPDFSGRYDISSLTPFQRPSEFGERLFLTEDEANAMASKAAKQRETGAKRSDPDRDAPKVGGNVGAYNDFWFEWGSKGFAIDGKFRTSSKGRGP